MKFLKQSNGMDHHEVKAGKKYKSTSRVLEAILVLTNGVVFKVLSLDGTGAPLSRVDDEIFYHNNDHGFWSSLKEYVPPPVKEKVFIIIWRHLRGHVTVTKNSELQAAEYYIREDYLPMKGFEVEFDVPQTGD